MHGSSPSGQVRLSPSRDAGQVFAQLGTLALDAAPVGLVVAGPVADLVGILPWLLISGIPMALIGVGSFLVPSIMNIEDPANCPVIEDKPSDSPEADQ